MHFGQKPQKVLDIYYVTHENKIEPKNNSPEISCLPSQIPSLKCFICEEYVTSSDWESTEYPDTLLIHDKICICNKCQTILKFTRCIRVDFSQGYRDLQRLKSKQIIKFFKHVKRVRTECWKTIG